LTTQPGEVIRRGDTVIDIRLPYEYVVSRINHGTAWLRKVTADNMLASVSIQFREDRHAIKIC